MSRLWSGNQNRAVLHWRLLTRPQELDTIYIATGRVGPLYTPGISFGDGQFNGHYYNPEHTAFSLITSTDGITWKVGIAGGIPGFNFYCDPWWVLNSGRTLVVGGWMLRKDDYSYVGGSGAVPTPVTGLIYSLNGGRDWTMPAMDAPAAWAALEPPSNPWAPTTYRGAVGNGRFVVWANEIGLVSTVISAPTTDPSAWVLADLPTDENVDILRFVDGMFLMLATTELGFGNTQIIRTSFDGITWAHRTTLTGAPELNINTVASNGSMWLALGNGTGTPNWSSTDQGASWVHHGSSPGRCVYNALAWHDGLWVAGIEIDYPVQGDISGRAALWWSTDGLTWTKGTGPPRPYIGTATRDPFIPDFGNALGVIMREVYWDGDQWWAVGISSIGDTGSPDGRQIGNVLARSDDGKAWTPVDLVHVGGAVVLTGIRKLPPATLQINRPASAVSGATTKVRARRTQE
jgi:hypothetical protein